MASKMNSKDFMSSKSIKWKQKENKKENTEFVSSKYTDLCRLPRNNAKQQENDEMVFFNRGGRHRRGMKSQFHHHHLPTAPLTSFSHSSPSSQQQQRQHRNKCDSPSVCNDANCQKERKCYCCCEYIGDSEKTKELNYQIGHPNRKSRRKGKVEDEEITGKKYDKKHDNDNVEEEKTTYLNHSVLSSMSKTDFGDFMKRNKNKGCKPSEMNTLEKMHDFLHRRCKTTLDEKMIINNHENRNCQPASSPLTRALLLDGGKPSSRPKSNLGTTNDVISQHKTELIISTPERKRRKMKQNPFNFDLLKDRSKTVENRSENTTHTTVASSQNLGTMMDEIKMSKTIIDRDLDEMKEKSILLEKDIILRKNDALKKCLKVTKNSLKSSIATTQNHDAKGALDSSQAQKKKIKMVAFGDEYLNKNINPFSKEMNSLVIANEKTPITMVRHKVNGSLGNQVSQTIQEKCNEKNDLKKDSDYVIIRKRKSGLVSEASEVIPSENYSADLLGVTSNHNTEKKDEKQNCAIFAANSISGSSMDEPQYENYYSTEIANEIKCSSDENDTTNRGANDTYTIVKETKRSQEKYHNVSTTSIPSAPKINFQENMKDVFVENPSKSFEIASFGNRILEERKERRGRKGGPYHIRFDGEQFQENNAKQDCFAKESLSPFVTTYFDGHNFEANEENIQRAKHNYKVQDSASKSREQRAQQFEQFNKLTSDKRLEQKLQGTKSPKIYDISPKNNKIRVNKSNESTNSFNMNSNISTSRLLPSLDARYHEIENDKKWTQKFCCDKNCCIQCSLNSKQKITKMEENMKPLVDMTSDRNSVVQESKETKEPCCGLKMKRAQYGILSNPSIKSGPLEKITFPHKTNSHNSENFVESVEDMDYENIPFRRAKTDLTSVRRKQKFDEFNQFEDISLSTPGSRKPITSSIYYPLLQTKSFSKSYDNISEYMEDEKILICNAKIFNPEGNKKFVSPIYCIDPYSFGEEPDGKNDRNQSCHERYDHIVHDKRRIPDGMAHMTELCTRHQYQRNMTQYHRLQKPGQGDSYRGGIISRKENIPQDDDNHIPKHRKYLRPKSDTFNIIFCTGQQCDNNFLRTAENTPCNHLNNVVERDDNKYKRPDMIAYTFDEVLTRPPQQREQSSGHLSFATRYNSREKRNNNQHNEFDNNNDDNDMPIDKKCSRKIEKKKEDGYAHIAERTSKHHKVECSNDIHSWTRAIEREEKDNQPSRHRTRNCQKIQDNDKYDREYSMEKKPSFELNGKGCNCDLKSKEKCRVTIDDSAALEVVVNSITNSSPSTFLIDMKRTKETEINYADDNQNQKTRKDNVATTDDICNQNDKQQESKKEPMKINQSSPGSQKPNSLQPIPSDNKFYSPAKVFAKNDTICNMSMPATAINSSAKSLTQSLLRLQDISQDTHVPPGWHKTIIRMESTIILPRLIADSTLGVYAINSGKNDDPSQTLPCIPTISSVSPFSSSQRNWERSHSSSNLNNSNGNKKKLCAVDLKEEKHGMRLMMLPPWPTTTSNASASHVPIDSSYVPHYFPKKNSVKEGRENIIKQVNMSSKVLKEYSTPPSPRAAMDLKHFDHYNFDDTVNSTCYLPSSKSYQKRGNEAQQTVRKMHDSIHDITGKYPSDLSAKWKKDADEKEQEDEGDFLIRDEEPEEVEELKWTKRNAVNPLTTPRFSYEDSSARLGVEQNERSKSKNTDDNETYKSKNGLPTMTEEPEEEGKRIEVHSRSEAFLSDTSCSLSSSSAQCSYQFKSIDPYLNDKHHFSESYIENQKQNVTKCEQGGDRKHNNDYDNNNCSVKSIYGVVCSGHIQDNNDDNFQGVKHDNQVSNVGLNGENIIPGSRNKRHLIVDPKSIEPCNLRLPPPPPSSPYYHSRDNKFSIEENVDFEEKKFYRNDNQDKNVSQEKGGNQRSDEKRSWCNAAADAKCNCYNPHNYHPDQKSILSVDKRCDTRNFPSYHHFVGFEELAHEKNDKESDKIVDNSVTKHNTNDRNTFSEILRPKLSNLHVNGVESKVNEHNLFSYNYNTNKSFSKSTPNISRFEQNSEDIAESPNLDKKEIASIRPKSVPSKTKILRPVSLIEERVEDFHIIHEAGSCEFLSSSIPHSSDDVPLFFDTILTHPTKSPSNAFKLNNKCEGKSQTKEDNNNNNLKEENFDPDKCYKSTHRPVCYRSSIRIMVRPENLLHMQQQGPHHNNPVIPRSNSLEGISSSSSSSSSSSVSENARSAKKMSAASLARHKISTHESPEGDNTFSDMSSENTQPSIVKEQFRLPKNLLEKMPSATNSPLIGRKSIPTIPIPGVSANLTDCDVSGTNTESTEQLVSQKNRLPLSVASMVRRFERDSSSKSRAGSSSSVPRTPTRAINPEITSKYQQTTTPLSSRTSSLSSSQGFLNALPGEKDGEENVICKEENKSDKNKENTKDNLKKSQGSLLKNDPKQNPTTRGKEQKNTSSVKEQSTVNDAVIRNSKVGSKTSISNSKEIDLKSDTSYNSKETENSDVVGTSAAKKTPITMTSVVRAATAPKDHQSSKEHKAALTAKRRATAPTTNTQAAVKASRSNINSNNANRTRTSKSSKAESSVTTSPTPTSTSSTDGIDLVEEQSTAASKQNVKTNPVKSSLSSGIVARAKSALKVETNARSSTAGPISAGAKSASSSRTKSSCRPSTIPENSEVTNAAENNENELRKGNEAEYAAVNNDENKKRNDSSSQIVPTKTSISQKNQEGRISVSSRMNLSKNNSTSNSTSDTRKSSSYSNAERKKSSTQKLSSVNKTESPSTSSSAINTKKNENNRSHQASSDLPCSSLTSKHSISSTTGVQQKSRPGKSTHSAISTDPPTLSSQKKSNVESIEADVVDGSKKQNVFCSNASTPLGTRNKTSSNSKPSHGGILKKSKNFNEQLPKQQGTASSTNEIKPSSPESFATESSIQEELCEGSKKAPLQNLLHLRVAEQDVGDKLSSSMDNLSTHVNASSGGSSQASDHDVSSGSDSPVPQQPLSISPEPAYERSHASGRNDTRAITPIVSSASDSEETDSFPTMMENMPGNGYQATSPGSTLSAISKINKRSESDGIVVAERPRPDKQPVRRCESSDDAGIFGSGSTSNDAISDSASNLASETDRIQFPKNIKTVSSATIVKGPEDATHSIGETVQFRAHYFGNPEPRVTWIKNSNRITVKDLRINIKTYSGESTLIVKDLRADDSGKYEVFIENEIGNDAASASLSVEGPPEPPSGRPYVSNIDTSSLTLAWYGSTYDGGSMVTGYIVEMSSWPITSDSRPPEATDWTVVDSHHTTSYIVQNLDPGREYIFRVKAENSHGQSEPSRVSEPVCFGMGGNSGNEDELGTLEGGNTREGSLARDESIHEEYVDHDPTFEAPFEHRNVVIEKGDVFKQKYEIFEELGRGRFGVVFKVKDRSSGEQFAAKFIRCRKSEEKIKVRDEIEIMNSLAHSKLLQLASAYENPREMIMVMEYIGGGELFEKVVADDFTLTERDCLLFMRQICQAIGYMHEQSIVHLDLKPENILCKSKSSHQVKIIDFGLARKLEPGKDIRILFGTPEFVSPEVISYEPVSTVSDMWSVGVVCYVLLSGLSPFMGDSDVETFANISGISYDFEDEAFDSISEEAKDFIRKLLVKFQNKRLTAAECLQHRWLAQPEKDKNSWKEINTDKLKSFLLRRRWQKAAHAIRALGRFTSLGFHHDLKDSASSITAFSTQSANF